MRGGDKNAGCGDPLGGCELADGTRDALGQRIVVGAKDHDARCSARASRVLTRKLWSLLRAHGARVSPVLDPSACGGSASMPSSSDTRNNGRPFTSSYMRPRYSPITPSERSCTPEKNITEMMRLGKPGTSVPNSNVLIRNTMA